MDDNFELTQEEKDQIEIDTRLHIAGLYQQMLHGDQNAEQRLQKICDGALVYHRDHCLSPIEAAYARNDLNIIAGRFDDWILEAIDHQKHVEAFEQEEFVAGYGGMTASLREQREVESHLAMLDREDQVASYIDEALAFDDDDLDYGEDHTVAAVCRM